MKGVALKWLEGLSDEWLMIYDNHPDKERLAPILPRRNTGNIIYTSRSEGFLADLPAECVCEVKSLSEEDGVDLLLRIAGREDSRTDEEEMEALHGCVVEVGCLPLAIESMGAYLRRGDCTALTYLQEFRGRQNRSRLLSAPNSDGSFPARPALYTALDLSYDAILSLQKREGRGVHGAAAQSALAALNLLCFYHNEEIPVTMIERSAKERQAWGSHLVSSISRLAKQDDPVDSLAANQPPGLANAPPTDPTLLLACHYPQETWDSTHFSLGTQILQQFSLIRRSQVRNTISMHVMVQAWAQDKMSDETRRRQALFAQVVLIESIKPGWNRMDQAWMRCLTPHFDACMAHETAALAHHYAYEALLDHKLGWYYYQQKNFAKAVDYFEKMLRVRKFNSGGYSEATTQSLKRLGQVYHDMGRIGDAEAAYLEVLDRLSIRKDNMLEEFKERLDREKEQQKKEARRQKQARLTVKEASSEQKGQPLDTPSTHDSMANQDNNTPQPMKGTLEHVLEEVDLVMNQEQQMETLTMETLTMWDFEEGSVYAEFATLMFDSGRFKAGRECLRKAIEVAKLDNKHDFQIWAWEDELMRRSGGAGLDYWLRRYKDVNALPPDLNEKFHGHDYAFVLPIGLADAFLAMGDVEEAYNTYGEVLEGAPMLYGPSDRKTLFVMRSMAMCAVRRGLFEEAEELARKGVEAAKTAYGQWHYQTALCLNNLATVLAPQTLHLEPGSEYWNITQEAYDAVRVAFWEEHPLAKRLKKRLEEASSEPEPTRGTDESFFQDVMAKIFADGAAPKSAQEYYERGTVAQREVMRERYQAEDKLSPGEKRRLARQRAAARAELKVPATDTQETQPAAPTIETAEGSRSRKSRKGKEKETATPLSPIPEDPASMAEEASDDGPRPDVKGKGKALPEEISREVEDVEREVSEILPEELEPESRNHLWTLEIEAKVGGGDTPGEPWIHIWQSQQEDGRRKRMVTGAVLGDGEPRWRRIRSWADFNDLEARSFRDGGTVS
jgi:tetratricopeptide (TPR) repeat protein